MTRSALCVFFSLLDLYCLARWECIPRRYCYASAPIIILQALLHVLSVLISCFSLYSSISDSLAVTLVLVSVMCVFMVLLMKDSGWMDEW